jgi:hypothetical protein
LALAWVVPTVFFRQFENVTHGNLETI